MCAPQGGAAAIEALCLLQDREEGLQTPRRWHYQSIFQALRDPENRGRAVSIVTQKKLVQLKEFDQHSFGIVKVQKRA